MITTPPTATILHLSDLHLGERFDDTGSKDKATLKSIIKKGRIEMQTHNPYIFAGLHTEVRSAARYIGAPGEQFDFHVITGDISTNATSQQRFAFARKFLTAKVPIAKTFSAGLKLSKNSVLCVPGNHDKMYETKPERYLHGFKDLPQPPPYVIEKKVARSEQQFCFFGIDSNLYEEGNIAIGKITPATLAWLGEQLDKYGPVDGQQDRSVRILLLHHHPADLNKLRRRSWNLYKVIQQLLMDRLTVLEEGKRLLEICRGKIDLILHGHEHFPIVFLNQESGCIIVSAGTTSEWQPGRERNSFHALAFQGREFRIVQFNWGTAQFSPCLEWTGNLDSPNCNLKCHRIN